MIRIEVASTYEEYFESTRLLNLYTTVRRRRNFQLLWYAYPAFGAVFALLTVFTWTMERRLTSGVILNICAAAFFFCCRFSFDTSVRRLYNQQKKDLPGIITLSPEGMRFERANRTASTDYSWSAFDQWLERPEIFLLFPGPLTFIRIPKAKLTIAEQDQLRTWLSTASKHLE